jgi:aminoglycoside phosphotransferase (APT) family kinase protein
VKLAHTLADIHSVPAGDHVPSLLDANSEALYFLRNNEVTADMKGHPDGEQVWRAAHEAVPGITFADPVLVHLDYWTGNVLWRDRKVAAVVDWEEAAFGDPAIDVAYMRLDLSCAVSKDAADEFVSAYRRQTGRPLNNLAFWDLAAAARPMPDPGKGAAELRAMGYERASAGDLRRRLREFIEDALKRLG